MVCARVAVCECVSVCVFGVNVIQVCMRMFIWELRRRYTQRACVCVSNVKEARACVCARVCEERLRLCVWNV